VRRLVVVKRLVALAAFVVAAAYGAFALAQNQHGAQPEPPHRGNPDDHGQLVDPKHEGPHDKTHPEAHKDAHHGPEPINWTNISDKERPAYLALVINLGLLLGAYYVFGKKGISEGLKKRRATIGKDIDEARKILQEAKERAKKYQADLKNADTDAATAKTTLVTAAKGEVERLLAEAKERAERMKRDAERLVEQESKQVAHDLLLETVEKSLAEAEKVLRENVTADDHARLAQDLLGELAKASPAQDQRRPL
jgi:F-type H+-transporting ATPase subunit b